MRCDRLHALDRCFDCPVEAMVVPPKTAANLALRFAPQLAGVRSVARPERMREDQSGSKG